MTAAPRPVLDRIVASLGARPDGFAANPKLERILSAERDAYAAGTVDWALAESLAFGSLLLEGTPVRLAGQDTRRGTFSQRHGVLVDPTDGTEYVPLQHVDAEQARFQLYDSVLSEYAALGFEYGYSVADRSTLVLWEAQFGDFTNGAQIIIDQFIVAAADKWGQRSSLAMLLPHGFEGQGPEHSSARIERFLALCADENLRVVYPSTAAQYFHVLRRQARSGWQIPLVCFTPKRYLRMEQSRSPDRRSRGRRLPPRPRRPVKAAAGDGRARRAVHRQARARADGRPRRVRRAGRGRAGRAALPVARDGAAGRPRPLSRT